MDHGTFHYLEFSHIPQFFASTVASRRGLTVGRPCNPAQRRSALRLRWAKPPRTPSAARATDGRRAGLRRLSEPASRLAPRWRPTSPPVRIEAASNIHLAALRTFPSWELCFLKIRRL